MDEHFAELFARYEALAPQRALQPAAQLEMVSELVLARSAATGS
jgi:hypothetical protein